MGPDGTWGSMVHIPTGATPSGPSATVYQNNIYLFVRGVDNNIYYAITVSDSLYWNYWYQLPGQTTKITVCGSRVISLRSLCGC